MHNSRGAMRNLKTEYNIYTQRRTLIMKDRIILGKNAIFNYDEGINNNIAVFATTGAGKTKSIVEPTLLNTFDSSLVVSLAKRELYYRYKEMFEDRGYEVIDLNLLSSNSPYGYDPMQYIKKEEDIISLATAIASYGNEKLGNSEDPYWYNGAVCFLSAIIGLIWQYQCNPLHIKMDVPGILDMPTFADVLDIYQNMDISFTRDELQCPLQYLFDAEERRKSGNFACRMWNSVKNLPQKTFGCIYSIASTALENLFTPTTMALLQKKKKIDIPSLGEKKTIVFVTTSPVNTSANRFANLFYGDLFRILYEHAQEKPTGTLTIPVRVFCDDFAVTSKINNFPKLISVFRSSGISSLILLQSESQLADMYGPADATTIINNCDTYVYMGGNDLKTAEHISKRANLPLEDILYAPLGKVLIFRRGSKPVMTERYPIFEDAAYIENAKQQLNINEFSSI